MSSAASSGRSYKTLQALALILHRVEQGAPGRSTLVVAPTSVALNWRDEIARFAPTLRPVHYTGTDRAGRLADVAPNDVIICSYTIMQQDIEILSAREWPTIILDEAQAIKNVSTRRARAALQLRGDFRIILSGTPVENHLGELWTLFRFLVPGLLGSLRQFQRRFAVPIERDGLGAARERLRRLVAPFILRRLKSQVLPQLPPRTEVTLYVDPGAGERNPYEALRQRAVDRAQATDNRIEVLAEIMTLRRACCHPRLVLPESTLEGAKLQLFVEVLGQLLDSGHRALVFSQFTAHLALVRERLDELKIGSLYLDGATPVEERKTRVDAFQIPGGTRLSRTRRRIVPTVWVNSVPSPSTAWSCGTASRSKSLICMPASDHSRRRCWKARTPPRV